MSVVLLQIPRDRLLDIAADRFADLLILMPQDQRQRAAQAAIDRLEEAGMLPDGLPPLSLFPPRRLANEILTENPLLQEKVALGTVEFDPRTVETPGELIGLLL